MAAQIFSSWTAYPEMIGTGVALVLTLCVFSYLLGDNALFRLAEHIFVGVAVGYAAVVVFHTVLVPKLLQPLMQALAPGDWMRLLPLLFPLLLGLLLLIKAFSRTRSISWLGNLAVALLLGVGSALAIQGALFGTLVPQVNATADIMRYVEGHSPGVVSGRYGPVLGLLSGGLVLVGTIGVLLHFSFSSGRKSGGTGMPARLVAAWGGLGRWFVFVAFGAVLATTFVSRLSLLVGRLQFLLDAVRVLIGVQ